MTTLHCSVPAQAGIKRVPLLRRCLSSLAPLVAGFLVSVGGLLPAAASAAQSHEINNFDPNLPTLSVQELKQKLAEYDRADPPLKAVPPVAQNKPIVAPAAQPNTGGSQPTVKVDMNDPAFLARVASGDIEALKALSGQYRAQNGLPATTGSPQSISLTPGTQPTAVVRQAAKGKNGLAGRVAEAMALPTDPQLRATMTETGPQAGNARFPVSYTEAQEAVKLFAEGKVNAVKINYGRYGGAYNVVDANGPYAKWIKPFDVATQPKAADGTNDYAGKVLRKYSDAPTNTVTPAFDDKPYNPNGVYGESPPAKSR